MSVLPDTARPVPVLPVPELLLSLPSDHCSCDVTSPSAGIILLRIRGEVDLYTIGRVEDGVRSVLASRPRHVVVDLTGMGFCGLRGLATIVTAHLTAAGLGIGFSVCGAPAQAVRVWSVMWDRAERPPLHPDVGTAVCAARSAREDVVEHRVAELPARVGDAQQRLGVR